MVEEGNFERPSLHDRSITFILAQNYSFKNFPKIVSLTLATFDRIFATCYLDFQNWAVEVDFVFVIVVVVVVVAVTENETSFCTILR